MDSIDKITKVTTEGFNVTNFSIKNESPLWYDDNKELFWLLVSIAILVAIVGVVGNALVIYAATQKKEIGARFRHLNHAVASLAIADFLLSLFGTPCDVVYWYWGKI